MENQGSDSALYAICGDAHRMQLFGDCDWNECESGMSLREDIMIEERGVPSRQLSFPPGFRLRAEPPDDRRYKPRFLDCHAIISSVSPDCVIRSFSCVVSDNARRLISEHTNEVAFVPIDIVGAPSQYFAFWVTNVLDIVDRKRSVLDEYPPGAGRFRIVRSAFKGHDGQVSLAVRQARHNYWFVRDYVTRAFVDLVRSRKLTGFEFYDPYTLKQVR